MNIAVAELFAQKLASIRWSTAEQLGLDKIIIIFVTIFFFRKHRWPQAAKFWLWIVSCVVSLLADIVYINWIIIRTSAKWKEEKLQIVTFAQIVGTKCGVSLSSTRCDSNK